MEGLSALHALCVTLTSYRIMPRQTEFISVEVVIKTDCDYEAFVEWFAEKDNHVSVLPCDTHRAHIYFAPLAGGTPDAAIQRICLDFEQLPDVVRDQWNRASFRQFFIGYSIGDEPLCFIQEVSARTLSAAASLGAGIGWALYAEPDEDACTGIPTSTP